MKMPWRWKLKGIPLGIVLVALWASVRLAGIALNSVGTMIVAGVCMAVLMIEFNRSADPTIKAFRLDQLYAVVATSMLWAAACYIWMHNGFQVADLFVVATVVADAYMSPLNSMKCTMRNMQAGVNTAAPEAE